MILAIDPGSTESAYVILDEDLKPIEFGKFVNENVKTEMRRLLKYYYTPSSPIGVAIEMVASYGMSVGATVFETCVWIGRFTEMSEQCGRPAKYIYRKDEKMNLCHSMKAKDSNITQALVDRFSPDKSNHGKGTKKDPGWFYGFSKDVWQAYAVGVTYHDLYIKPQQ
jgi:hypothetical protein